MLTSSAEDSNDLLSYNKMRNGKTINLVCQVSKFLISSVQEE